MCFLKKINTAQKTLNWPETNLMKVGQKRFILQFELEKAFMNLRVNFHLYY